MSRFGRENGFDSHDDGGDDLNEIDGTVVARTGDAMLFLPKGVAASISNKGAVWLPISRCSFDEETGVMTIPAWLCEREGL